MMGQNKWKLLTIVFLLTTIISASFAGYYEHKSCVVQSGLERFALGTIGVQFLHLVPVEELTEENVDEFMDQLLQNSLVTSYYISELQRCDINAELYSGLTQLEDLCPWAAHRRMGMIAGEWQVISKMTNKTWKKEALEELVSHSKDDFEKIGVLLVGGKLSDAAKIAVNSEARQYASSPAPYPIKVGTDKDEYKIGENITFWLKNNWDRTIELLASPYAILEDVGPIVWTNTHGLSHRTEWKQIYEPNITQAIHLKPGEKREWIWNQKEANNTQVDVGDYKVVFSVEGWAEGTYSEPFWIENENKMRM